MKLSDLYSEHFANWISSGDLVRRDKISLLGIRSLFDRYVTNQYVTKVWMIMAFPVRYDKNLTHAIRTEMFKHHPNVKTIIHFTGKPVNVNVRGSMFMRQFDNVSKRYNAYKDKFENLTADQQLVGISEVDPRTGKRHFFDANLLNRIRDEYDSYMYLFSQATDGRTFTNTTFFIQASAKSKKELKMYQKTLENFLTGQKILFKGLHGNVSQYLSNYCPATYQQPQSKKFPTVLLSDSNSAGLVPTKTRGLLGGAGVMMGLDVQTWLPLIMNFFGSGTAQIIMMLGKTGCGKTYMGFNVALGIAALGVHFSAIDIKGNEWRKVLCYYDGIEFDMGSQNSRFVNTMRLDDLECDSEDEAEEAFLSAVNGTVSLFKIIVNLQENEGNNVDLDTILRQAVTKVFSTNDVISNNPDTFYRTKNLWYSEVLNTISNLSTSSAYSEQYKKLCSLIITRCSPYFMPEGLFADSFKNEITLKEIIESPITIYSFGKNQGEDLGTLDSLRVFMVQFLDGKKQYMRKKKKLHTAAFYEELQRCQSFGALVNEISHKVTGSRSNNVTIFLLFNAISILDEKDFKAIKSNITTKIVGKVEKPDIQKLVDDYGCQGIKGYLESICDNESGKFNHCFAIQYDTGLDTDKTIFKTVMPKELSEHFNTRDVMNL